MAFVKREEINYFIVSLTLPKEIYKDNKDEIRIVFKCKSIKFTKHLH